MAFLAPWLFCRGTIHVSEETLLRGFASRERKDFSPSRENDGLARCISFVALRRAKSEQIVYEIECCCRQHHNFIRMLHDKGYGLVETWGERTGRHGPLLFFKGYR